MPIVRMPDGTLVRFRDEMSQEDIRSAIASKFPGQVPPRDDALTSFGKGVAGFAPATEYAGFTARTATSEALRDLLDPTFEYRVNPDGTVNTAPAPSIMRPGVPVEEYLNQPAPITGTGWSPLQYLPEDVKRAGAEKLAKESLAAQLNAEAKLKTVPEANVAPGSLAEFTYNLGSALPDVAVGFGAGVAAVPTRGKSVALSSAYFAGKAAGPKYAEARKLGLSHDAALAAATLSAAAEGATETLSSLVFAGGLGKTVLRSALTSAATEGATEGATEAFNILIDMGILREDMTLEEALNRVRMASSVGAVAGGTIGGAMRAIAGRDPDEIVPDDKAAPTRENIVGTNFGTPAGADPGIAETLGNVAAQPKAITREKKLALPPPDAPEDVVSPIVPRQQTIALSPTEEQIAQKAADRTRATLNVAREVTTPVGSFSMDEVGPDVAGKVNLWRMRTGRQPDAPVSVADMKAAKVEPAVIDALVLTRKPLTGEQGLASSTRPALESTVLRTGPFTEEQYGAGVASVRTAGRFTLKGLQEATGTTPAAAKLIRDEMVKRGDLVEGTRPGTFKPYVRPAAPSTQSPLKTHTVAPVATDTITVKKDGKVFGVFEDQVAAKDAVRGIREREKAEQNPPSKVQIVRGGVDAEGKAMAERPAFAVYENRYDADGNIVDRAIVSTHVTEDAARAEADTLASRPVPEQTPPGVAAPRAPRPSVIARSRPQTIPTPKVVEGRLQEIVDKLNEQANRRALPLIGNRVQIVEKIADTNGESGIEGSYLRQLIELSVENLDPNMSTAEIVEALAEVMDHETIHALREAGVLGPGTRAWTVLSNYVQKAVHPRTGETYLQTAININPELVNRPDVIVEEAIAEAFRMWAANKRAVAGVPRTALEKIVEWFKRLVGSIPEDVFRSIETGTLARSRIRAPMSYRGKAVEMMEQARVNMASAQTPEQVLAAQRQYLQAREQAAEDRVGRAGPVSVLGTTPSNDYLTGPRAATDRVETLIEKADTDLKLAPTPNYGTPDQSFMMKLADAYQQAKHEPSNIAVSKAYSSLIAETKAVFNTLNVTVVPWRENGQPYASQREMLDDIANGKIVMRLSNELFPPHPSRRNHPMQEPSGITTEDGTALSNNDLLRVVAEAYGYAPVGAVPSMLGDYRAYHTLKGMYSDQGKRALATEMLAQSAWHNAGPKMRLSDGSIAPPDALGYVPSNMREFAEQKATLLPPEALAEPPQEEIIDLSNIGDETRYSRGVFRQDNPAVSRGDTNWLKAKQETANTRPNKIGGAITGYMSEPVMLDTTVVAKLPGAMGEKPRRGEPKYDAVRADMEKNGYDAGSRGTVLIGVNHTGDAFIIEGNNRVRAAADLGVPAIRADVRWYNGGEMVPGNWSPEAVEGYRAEARYSRGVNPQANTPEFKAWFKNSKVVDENGAPLVVYHGGASGITVFSDRVSRAGKTAETSSGGMYFTPDKSLAGTYGSRGEVYSVYLSVQNPLRIGSAEWKASKFNDITTGFIYREEIEALKAAGYDGVINSSGREIVVFDPTQIKSATDNIGTFDPANPDIRYSKGVNKHGLAPYLRQSVDTTGMNLPPKTLFAQETKNSTAQAQIDRITPVLDMFPDALKSEREWGRMMAYALSSDDVPVAPARLIKDLQDGTAIRNLKKMTPGQIADANHGFENAAKMRAAYLSGAADIDVTGKLFLWSFLSRGVSPYTQEGLFIDAYNGIEPWLRYAARGEWDPTHTERYRYGTPEIRDVVANYLYQRDTEEYAKAKKAAEKKGRPFNQDAPRKIEWSENPDGTVNLTYRQWARLAAPPGMGQPGAGASHNLNAFGNDFLAKMSQSAGDGTGRSRLRVIHDMMASPNSTGKQIRRKFMTMGEGVGIDNKVVSFTLLVAGFPDVMVLDRVQVRQLWNDGRFGDINLYDGVKDEKTGNSVTGTALSDITYGARGLLIYEAIEREIAERMNDIYTELGRPQDASIGRYHWDTWVTDSGQEASHGTLGAILPRQYGGDSLSAVTAKQGEYGSYAYGARYGVDGRGTSYFNYETPSGKLFTFSVPGFVEFQQEIKKPANKVVPPNFSVTGEKKNADGTKTKDNFNGPWYTRPEVNTRQLEALAAKYTLGEAGSEPGTIRTSGLDAPIPDGLAARAYPADTDETRYSRGVKYGPAEQSRLPARNRGAGRYALGDLAPLAGAPQVKGAAGPDPRLVAVAEQYARDNGIELRRQAEYVKVDPDRARRIAAAYEAMPHAPQDPKVKEAYQDLIRQTIAQYRALEKAGYKFWFIDINSPEGQDYSSTPWNAMRDIRANQSMGVFPTATGFGTSEQFSPDANPLLIDTGIRWPWGSPDGPVQPVLANDLFRAVHDAFGHGIEGSGFRAEGEENAWQAHIRLFTGPAVGAITSETRGQNSWLNYGPYGETNRNAKVEDTVFADQKTGLMPEWTWLEGRAGDMGEMTAANSYNVGSPEFYAMLDEVTPGGKYYGDPKRSAAAVTVPADVSAPNFSQSMDGNVFFGGDIAYHQLQMTRDGDRGAVMTYMAPEDFLRLADQRPAREQALYDAAVADGYKFNTLPSLVVESGKAGTVPVLNSDGVAMVRALVGKVKAIPVVLYPSGKGQIENVEAFEANGDSVDLLAFYEFDIERRGPRHNLSSVAFNAWFKQSAVVDENGAPKRMYHNTKSDRNFDIFDTRMSEFGSHFGTVEQANERNEKGHGYPVYLSIQNPVRLVDEGEFDTFTVARQLYDQGIIDQRTYDNVRSYTVSGMVVLQDALIERGYDGVVYLNKREGVDVPNWSDWNLPDEAFKEKYPEAQDSYIVFQPTQVKSAIANRGTWSSADPDIRYSKGRARTRVTPHGGMVYNGVYDRVQGWFSTNLHNIGRSKKRVPVIGSIFDYRVNFEDNFIPIKDLYDKLMQAGLPVPAELNAYIVEQSVGSAAAYQIKQREQQFVEPMTAAMKEGIEAKRFTYDDVIDFLYALHAPERNAYLRARGSKAPNPSGMSDDTARQILADAKTKGTFDELMKIGRMAADIVADINKTRLDTGQITAEVAAASPFTFWVPLRDTEDTDPHDFISKPPRADNVGKGLTSWGKRPDKRMFGRRSKAGDIVANLVSLQAVTVMRGERARVGQSLVKTVELAEAAGIPMSLKLVRKYPTRLAYGADGMIREIADPNFRKDPRYLVFKVDGKEVVLETDDPYVSEALRSPMVEQFNDVMRLVMWARRSYTALITARDPNFVLANFVRDMQEALINTTQFDIKGLIPKVVGGIPQSAIAIAEYQLSGGVAPPGSGDYTKYYEEMDKNGWLVSFLAPTDLAKTINRLRRDSGALEGGQAIAAKAGQLVDSAMDKWDGINNVAEGAMRLSLYAAMRDAGASITEAGVAAKNLTINFNKGGKYKQQMDTLYLFASVVTKGLAVSGRMMKSKRGLAVLTGIISMGFIMSALNRALSDDEDENGVKDYDQLTEDELSRNIILPVDKFGIPGITQPLKIPMAIGVYGAIYNLGRNLERAIDGFTNPRQPIKADGAVGRAIVGMVGAISPVGTGSSPAVVIAPWFLDPFISVYANKNWADMDIVPPSYDETKPMSQRFYRTTDNTFVWAAQKLNELTGGSEVRKGSLDWSPEHLQFWFEFATAGTGKFLLDAKYSLFDAPQAVIAGEEVDLGKVPVVKRFVTGTSTRRGGQDLYYTLVDEVKTTENELKDRDLRAAGKARIAASGRVRTAFDRSESQLRDLRKQLRAAMENKTMTQEARLQKINKLRDKMTEVMNRAVAAYYDAAEKKAGN